MRLIDQKTLLPYVRLRVVIVIITVILCLMIWPFQYLYHSSYSVYGETEPAYTGNVTMEEIVLQEFSPAKDHIRDLSVSCRVNDVHYMDRVFVTLYDAGYNILYQEVLQFPDIELRGGINITPELDVIPGETYYLGFNVHFDSIGTLQIACADQSVLQIEECGALAYAGIPFENQAILIQFHYTAPYSAGLRILCIVCILACGALLYFGIVWLCEFFKKKQWMPQFLRGCLAGMTAAGALFTGFCFYQLCIAKFFGGEIWDWIVYAAACLIVLGLLWYAFYKGMRWIGHMPKKMKLPRRKIVSRNREVWVNDLQILCLVGLFYEGVAYVNASVQWKQDFARNMVFMLFGLFVLLTLKLREVVNVFSAVWVVVLIPAGVLYCHWKSSDMHELQIAGVLTAAAGLWGIVLIHTLRDLKKLRGQKWNIPLCACFALMCVFMMLNSFGKAWPFYMTVTFTLFYLQSYTEKEKDRIVHNMVSALLAHFGLMILMCCLHRPYHYYRFNRYPMWFHTVASTGIYLSAVAAASLLRLFLAIRDSGHVFKKAWKEWIGNAVVLVYILFAMPRTAVMAVLGMGIILTTGAVIVYRPKVRYVLQIGGILILSVVISMPVVYTVTRCVPAIVNKPVYLNDAEDFDEAVREGEAPDSARYMYVRALVRLWANRLWVPQDFIERYLEDRVSAGQPFVVLAEVASEEMAGLPGQTSSVDGSSALNDMSNGRIAIFRDYLEHLKWSGHPQMGYDEEHEMLSGHAHNSFIQNAFDFGIPAGILFLVLILLMILNAVYRIWTGKERSEKQFMLLLTGSAFLLVSLTEYVSNPCMPLCFSTLFMLITMRTGKNVVK